MGLILEGVIRQGVAYRADIVPFYLLVAKRLLSIPYQVIRDAYVEGIVLDIEVQGRTALEEERRVIQHVVGKAVQFYLSVLWLGTDDHLYFTRPSWGVLRDAGIITPDYVVRVKLTKLKIEDEEVEIYPLRDVS